MPAHQSRGKAQRHEAGHFSRLPHEMQRHPNYLALDQETRQLITEVLYEYDGTNNGSLPCSFRWIKNRRHWRIGQKKFERLRQEALDAKFIAETYRDKQRTYYELTFIARDKGPHGLARMEYPSGLWRSGPNYAAEDSQTSLQRLEQRRPDLADKVVRGDMRLRDAWTEMLAPKSRSKAVAA